MGVGEIGPISSKDRIEVVDVLRGIAVGGILIGNMQWFSGYGMAPPEIASTLPVYDQITRYLVHVFIEGKFYSLFSFLFGFGFALQIARAEERGDTKASVFKRRLFWLLVIGLLHGFLLWAGDILSVYALVGFVLLLFRRKSNESLLKWAAALIIFPILFYILGFVLFVSFAPSDIAATIRASQADSWKHAVNTVSNAGYLQIISEYNLQYIVGRYIGLILQMRLPKILAMFLIGVYAYRRGIFQNLSEHKALIRRVLVYGLTIGVIGNLLFAAVAKSEADVPPSAMGLLGVVLYAFSVPALALGIAALVATLWQKGTWQKMLGVFAPAGRVALTNYLTQTVVCILIFYGYGLGYFGKFGAVRSTLLALGVFTTQIMISTLWLKYFAYGPIEWIWRQLTYGRRLNLRRS